MTITTGADAAELEKRIASALMEATLAITLDNLNATALRSVTLESALTERPSYACVMGGNRIVALNATALCVTGNGLTLSSDTACRFLTVELDAGTKEPETRAFTGDLVPELPADCADLLRDALIVWRWGRQAGDALPRGLALGSFGQWCRWCRDPLLALGCADPVRRIADAKLNDPRRRAVAELFHAWHKAHGSKVVTVAELTPPVLVNPEGKPRQWLAARIRNLAGIRLARFVLVHDARRNRVECCAVTPAAALAALDGIGVRVRLEADGTVRLHAADPPPPNVLASARAHRDGIAALLRGAPAVVPNASLLPTRPGIPSVWCEDMARLAILPAPSAITPRRWTVLAATSARLLRDHGAELHGAKWDALDVFGLHAIAPTANPSG